jgi:ABC-type phosphate/phosphonate transport system permease subunit
MKTPINKILYVAFLILGIYQAFFNKDFAQAAASFGIGLVFDPFNPNQKWNERPMWQKAVLILHLAIAATLLGFGIGFNDK